MSLALLFPLGLLALAAWALPLLLHLARREQRTPTAFAALRWLSIRQKPRQRLRFDEIVLLAVRLALIAALALLLARPAFTGGGEAAWEIVHPDATAADRVADGPVTGIEGRGTDPVAQTGVERRWLAPGFPPIDSPRPVGAVPAWSLLRQLDAELPAGAELTVRMPAVAGGADGGQARLSRPVRWLVDAPTAAAAPSGAPPAAARAGLAVRHDQAHAAAAGWLRAVILAWHAAATPAADAVPVTGRAEPGDGAAGEPAPDPASLVIEPVDIAPLDAPLPDDATTVIAWLAAGDLPAPVRERIRRGATVLLPDAAPWPLPDPAEPILDDEGVPVAEAAALGRGRVVRLRRPLRPDAWPGLLEPTFPQLMRRLIDAPPPDPEWFDSAAHPPLVGGAGFEPPPREVPAAIVWLALALFALERWLATGRRRGEEA